MYVRVQDGLGQAKEERSLEERLLKRVLKEGIDFNTTIGGKRAGITLRPKDAKFPYLPNRHPESRAYGALPPVERARVAKIVDRIFKEGTGIVRKLDEKDPKDRPWIRIWLTLRDHIMALRSDNPNIVRAEEASKRADAAGTLPLEEPLNIQLTEEELRRLGLPAPHHDPLLGKIVKVAGVFSHALEAGEMVELWSLPSVAPIALPLVGLLGTLYEIGEANELGNSAAMRNAWKFGFAATIAAMAKGQNWTSKNKHALYPFTALLGYQETRGRNAAIQLVKKMGSRVGLRFLKRYEVGGIAQVMRDLGVKYE